MTSCENSPHEVGQDIPVLVLPTAIITVQVDLLLPQPIVLKVAGDALHTNAKDAHLPRDQKIQGAKLHRERRKVHLLGIVKTEVHCKVGRTSGLGSKRRAASCSVSSLGIFNHVLVEGVLHEYKV